LSQLGSRVLASFAVGRALRQRSVQFHATVRIPHADRCRTLLWRAGLVRGHEVDVGPAGPL